MVDNTYQTKIYEKQGGDELVVASGGTVTVESGGTLAIVAGATVTGLAAVVEQTALADLAGTLTGSTDGTIADVAAIAISTAGGNTYADSAVNTAVNTAITSVNLQLKELQTKLNAALQKLRDAGVLAS